MTFDPSNDFETIVDALETVTFRRQNADAEPITYTDTTGVTALRRAAKRGERHARPVGTQLASHAVRWHLDAEGLPAGTIPRPRDRIKDSTDIEWIIE
jgi:hypothetical protein